MTVEELQAEVEGRKSQLYAVDKERLRLRAILLRVGEHVGRIVDEYSGQEMPFGLARLICWIEEDVSEGVGDE